jgi:hypothetical protein
VCVCGGGGQQWALGGRLQDEPEVFVMERLPCYGESNGAQPAHTVAKLTTPLRAADFIESNAPRTTARNSRALA